MDGKFVSYLRVSTDRQGKSGLGLEAQRAAVADHLNGGAWTLLGEFVEVESGGATVNRPQLAAAMALCSMTGARLLVAKLDRLSRDAHFLIGLQKAGTDFEALDMPGANRLTVGFMALIAQHERELISSRTKAALKAAKSRGQTLGGYRGGPVPDTGQAAAARVSRADAFAALVGPVARDLHTSGLGLSAIAAELTRRSIRTARGGTAWTSQGVKNLLARCV